MKKPEYEVRKRALIDRYAYMFAGHMVGLISASHEEKLAYAVDIEPGWFEIIERLCRDIDAVVPTALKRADGKGFHVTQVKEKFGTLRFYWGVGIGPSRPSRINTRPPGDNSISTRDAEDPHEPWRDNVFRLIDGATTLSGETCFSCGRPARLKRDARGWMYTSCDAHEGRRERFDF